MANFGLIALCLALGFVARRARLLPETAPAALNAFVLTISLPALAILSLHDVAFGGALLYPVGMAWILFAASGVFFALLGRAFGWRRETVGALMLTAGLGNTSFVGYPLLIALYGEDALKTGVLTDQPGTFLVLSSLGVITASICSARSPSLVGLPAKLLRFPPFAAMIVALAIRPWPIPAFAGDILKSLAATLVPLALVSVGMQMSRGLAQLRANAGLLVAGLGYKLLIGPALIYGLYVVALGAHGSEIQITIVQAAMAPMITGAILAADHGLEPGLSNSMISVGIPLSLLTVPLWASWLKNL